MTRYSSFFLLVGLNKLMEQHPDVGIYLAAVDENLNSDDNGGEFEIYNYS